MFLWALSLCLSTILPASLAGADAEAMPTRVTSLQNHLKIVADDWRELEQVEIAQSPSATSRAMIARRSTRGPFNRADKENLHEDEFKGQRTELERLIKALNDTEMNEQERNAVYRLLGAGSSGGPIRRIVFEDTILLRRALDEKRAEMTKGADGELKNDPTVLVTIMFNETTILVVKSVSKYYYWKVSEALVACRPASLPRFASKWWLLNCGSKSAARSGRT